ncbi:uncharacterized protein LOC122063107 isoform X1 [Macadamia integrifolia]|uniref:uncharacterized protein LOC122063107 isoform X1 n=1 Tax=Macadamia integrifolia TaxID=60698 RepID=UPI001C4FC19C|nr:uncharacterized protein LOC122063107 isoform X1 [Macadamia integrifolia]XP_042482717.1 uncharacterized protein LOC122063107 isoform X1 [Macadamia integrifolia]XP_042482718.1 uncharacterized protein LOC122063107 isoform X1 [Macadamia integrifolia]
MTAHRYSWPCQNCLPLFMHNCFLHIDQAYDTFIEAPPMSTSGSSPVDAFTSFPGILDTLPTKGQISLVPKDINLPNLPKWSYVKQGKEVSITRPCELIKENSRGYDYVPACNYEELVQMVAKLKSIRSEGDASASSLPDVSPPITAVTSATGEPVFQGTNAPPSSEIVEEGHTEDLPPGKTATSAS